ncbi:MAG: retroviral-like aspartic protease family protein [Bacteroides sp.]|nr:retroviral-like aspartic protease family protein [Bacteroides sp.]
MKPMIRFLLTACIVAALSPGCTTTTHLNLDETLATLIQEGKWFEVQRTFEAQQENLDTYTWDITEAMLLHYYNRPEQAIPALNKALDTYKDRMDGELSAWLTRILAEDKAAIGQYREASEIANNYLMGTTETTPETSRTFILMKEQYDALSKAKKINIQKPPQAIILPLQVERANEGVSLKTTGTINGNEEEFIIDTGAGVNLIDVNLAQKYNMTVLVDSIPLVGTGLEYGDLVIADTLYLGEITLRNIPFITYNFVSEDPEIQAYLSQNYRCVLGLPFWIQLEEIQINFTDNTITIPDEPTVSPLENPNLHLTDRKVMNVEIHTRDEALSLHFDSGAGSGSFLTYDYYQKHKNSIELRSTPETLYIGGVGGIKRAKSYKSYAFPFRLGNTHVYLPEIDIFTSPDNLLMEEEDGSFGVDMFMAFPEIIINFRDMFATGVLPVVTPE